MRAFLSNSTAAAEVGTNILRGISDMISSIPQEGKTEQNQADRIWHITQYHMLKAKRTIHILQIQTSSLLLVWTLVWCEGEQLGGGDGDTQHSTRMEVSYSYTCSPGHLCHF